MFRVRIVRRRNARHFITLFFLLFTVCSYGQIGPLIWEENFDTFDATTWTKDVGDGCDIGLCGWGNQELQWYSENNVSIQAVPGESGNYALALQARAEPFNGYAFTSGKVTSANKIAIQYGMIETRVRVPNVEQGLWPAAWMLGTTTLPWPNKGEIDMMEMGHQQAERERQGHPEADSNRYVGANIIFWAEAACVPENPTCAASTAWDVTQNKPYIAANPMNDRFIIYRTYWTESTIRFTVEDNGIEYDLYEEPFTITEESNALRAPFFLLLNMAVGGNFTDAAAPSQVTAPLPGTMYIDYIRVYQLDGQGEVIEGNILQPETGVFGVFTDTTPTANGLEAGVTSDIFVWDANSAEGNIAPYEGDNVIATSFVNPNSWFGGGVQTRQARDMSNFVDGFLRFHILIPADVSFRIGVTDTYTNENWLTFPAFETIYGLERNGQWGLVEIPISDLRGPLIALQSMQYLFAISSDPGSLPGAAFDYAIDNIVWVSDSEPPQDSDGDGVPDADDLCPNTPADTAVDEDGCTLILPGESVRVGTVAVSQPSNAFWHEVNFDSPFVAAPIVVMGAPSFNGSHALSVRVRNVTPTGFEFQLDEWDYLDGSHTLETLSYIAADEGVHDWGGLRLVAGVLALNSSWQTLSLSDGFSGAPMILAQQVSNTEVEATTVRLRNITAETFELRLQEEEAADGTHSNESVNYIAIAYGAGQVNGLDVLVGSTGRSVDHSWSEIAFGADYQAPQFMAGMLSQNGADTATVRYSALDGTGVSVKVHEEQSNDSETLHTTENIGWILMGVKQQVSEDSDNDGIPDESDMCPNTPPSTEVDEEGCPITTDDLFGIRAVDFASIAFFVGTTSWADVHYRVNNGGQQNIRMVQTGSENIHVLEDVNAGDQIDYWFTYWNTDGNYAVDSPVQSYTH